MEIKNAIDSIHVKISEKLYHIFHKLNDLSITLSRGLVVENKELEKQINFCLVNFEVIEMLFDVLKSMNKSYDESEKSD